MLFFSFFLSVVYFLLVNGHGKHKCIHSKISREAKISQNSVSYKNHPFESKVLPSQRRLIGNVPKKIRITPYFDAIDKMVTNNGLKLTTAKQYKKIFGGAIHYFERFVKVEPVFGNLKLSRTCANGDNTNCHFQEGIGTICNCYEYSSTCHGVHVPEEHFADDIIFDVGNKKASRILEGGNGVSNSDLIIYVTATFAQTDENCVGTLAFSTACRVDQYGRPIAGHMNICVDNFPHSNFDKGVSIIVHEMMHILFFDENLIQFFVDSNGRKRGVENVVLTKENVVTKETDFYLKSPNVLSAVRSHFGCQTLIGARLSNPEIIWVETEEGGRVSRLQHDNHWHARYFFQELMNANTQTLRPIVSSITLALMKDSGFYTVDSSIADDFAFGKNGGCLFTDGRCVENGVSKFPQFFCDDFHSPDGCSPDGRTLTRCQISVHETRIPQWFQYFSESTLGGNPRIDYCPVHDAEFVQIPTQNSPNGAGSHRFWDQNCLQSSFANILNDQTNGVRIQNILGINSRCVKLEFGQNIWNQCVTVKCLGFKADTKLHSSVEFTFQTFDAAKVAKAVKILCTILDFKDGVKKSLIIGKDKVLVTCPDPNLYCVSSKAFECMFGHYDEIRGVCVCSYGYMGPKCRIVDSRSLPPVVEIGNDVSSPSVSTEVCMNGSPNAIFDGNFIEDKTKAIFISPKKYITYFNIQKGFYLYFYAAKRSWVISQNMLTNLSSINGVRVMGSCYSGEHNPHLVNSCFGDKIVWKFTGFNGNLNVNPNLSNGKCNKI